MPTKNRTSVLMTLPPEFTRATAMPINPCTGAPGATPHWTCIAANPPGHASPPGTHGTGGKRSLPAGRPVRPVYQSDQIRTREGYRGLGQGFYRAIDDLGRSVAPLPIDQAESQRPRRAVEARGLANGLGRVRGAQVDLLQDRHAAIRREAQKLKPKGGARRAFGDDPSQLLDRISFRMRRRLD